ncbi:MAG: HXXEE domain-containing protein [Planctomycetota bacterium]
MISRFLQQLEHHWVISTGPAGLILLMVTPALAELIPAWLVWVWIQLPIYMLHQCEEHLGDRFRVWVNNKLGGGKELLTRRDVVVINLPGVWGVIAASFLLAVLADPGFGLIAIYLTLVNAVVHLIAAVRFFAPNPGIWTVIALFTPASVGGLIAFNDAETGTLLMHAIGLGVALFIHLAIVARVVFAFRRSTR